MMEPMTPESLAVIHRRVSHTSVHVTRDGNTRGVHDTSSYELYEERCASYEVLVGGVGNMPCSNKLQAAFVLL
jgi:hypothetical protein